ncbi:hypothetical protein QZH41_020263 [Actinostola sp. cb2023]|nr:hypothetical protein QZH41_020263 [Actinostola sp. cb2023]
MTKHSVAWADPPLLCSNVTPKNKYQDKAVAAVRGNCSFYVKGLKAQSAGGKAAIIINTENQLIMPAGNESAGDYDNLHIPVVILTKEDGTTLKDLGKGVLVQMYQPDEQPIDGNIVLLWILAVGTVVVGAYWTGIANNSIVYAWILQDVLGIAFCVSLLKNIRLPNLKVCIILLILLLIYDIFFVFITPLFSANGKSVMVEVATGGGHKEQLPMVLKLPKFSKSLLSVCSRPYSLLGFGDIIVPGLFIGFCHSFDIMQNTPKKIYFVATSIAYGVGLIITFAALFLMKKGQPALLYLVPCILTTGIVIGLARKEFRKLWTGKMVLSARHLHLAMLNNQPQPLPSSV